MASINALRTACRKKYVVQQIFKYHSYLTSEEPITRTPLQRTGNLDFRLHQQQVRCMSQQPNFFRNVWNNIKDGLDKDKEMKFLESVSNETKPFTGGSTSNDKDMQHTREGDRTYPPGYGTAKPVFLKEADVFGYVNNYSNKQWLNHAEVYLSLGKVIPENHLSGIQRTGNVWSIYADNMEDRVKLLARGVIIGGTHVALISENPETTTRLTVSDVPLSADDRVIKQSLEQKGCEIIEMYREKLRMENELTNCDTGDRIVFVKRLETDLPTSLQMGKYYSTVWYYGQPKEQAEAQTGQKCTKSLKTVKNTTECSNDWECLESRHRKQDCEDKLNGNMTDSEIKEVDNENTVSEKENVKHTDQIKDSQRKKDKKKIRRKPKKDTRNSNTKQSFVLLRSEGFSTPAMRSQRLSIQQTPPLPENRDNKKQKDGTEEEQQENLKKFREETKKLEESEALQKVKEKYMNIQNETGKFSQIKFDGVKEKLQEFSEHEMAKKGKEITMETLKTAGNIAGSLSKGGQKLGQSAPIKTISEVVRKELKEVDTIRAQLYKAPEALRKRSDDSVNFTRKEEVEANEDVTGMVLHKDSKWYQSWNNFKDNNQYVNKMFELKMKYDESDNVVVRLSRSFTDKVGGLLGGMFTTTEMSEVITEVCKIDPTFDRETFIKHCQLDFIPNILEATIRGDLEILKDWCYEAAFNTLAHPTKQREAAGYKSNSKILDIGNIEIAGAKMMEQGPVLIITFNAQEILVVRDTKGQIVEGDPDKVTRITYVWAMCRDQEEYNPKAAWKLLDISAQAGDLWY